MSRSSTRPHPTWDELASLVESDDPTLHVIDGEPPVYIFIDPAGPTMGLRTPFDGTTLEVRPLAEIEIRQGSYGGRPVMELATGSAPLFPYFYAFALALADRIQVDALDVAQAVEQSLGQWRALLRQVAMLSDEEQTGLMGELWMLRRLMRSSASTAIDAWVGPRGEAHDFRIGTAEFEVKSTRGERRVHLITTSSQLVPSPGCTLYVLSLQFAAAGSSAGVSISELLDELRLEFDASGLRDAFDALLLSRYGVGAANRGYYRERLKLRSDPYLVHVSDDFPCLRQDDILAISRAGMDRISDVRYRLDVSGLGSPDGSAEFLSVLPSTTGGVG